MATERPWAPRGLSVPVSAFQAVWGPCAPACPFHGPGSLGAWGPAGWAVGQPGQGGSPASTSTCLGAGPHDLATSWPGPAAAGAAVTLPDTRHPNPRAHVPDGPGRVLASRPPSRLAGGLQRRRLPAKDGGLSGEARGQEGTRPEADPQSLLQVPRPRGKRRPRPVVPGTPALTLLQAQHPLRGPSPLPGASPQTWGPSIPAPLPPRSPNSPSSRRCLSRPHGRAGGGGSYGTPSPAHT